MASRRAAGPSDVCSIGKPLPGMYVFLLNLAILAVNYGIKD